MIFLPLPQGERGYRCPLRVCGVTGTNLLSQIVLPVLPAVKQTQDGNGLIGYHECDGDAPLEADDAEAGSDVIAGMAALRCQVEPAAIAFEPFDIGYCDMRARLGADPLIERKQIRARFRRKDNVAGFQADSSVFRACRTRMSSKTDFAGMPRDGSASMAS